MISSIDRVSQAPLYVETMETTRVIAGSYKSVYWCPLSTYTNSGNFERAFLFCPRPVLGVVGFTFWFKVLPSLDGALGSAPAAGIGCLNIVPDNFIPGGAN